MRDRRKFRQLAKGLGGADREPPKNPSFAAGFRAVPFWYRPKSDLDLVFDPDRSLRNCAKPVGPDFCPRMDTGCTCTGDGFGHEQHCGLVRSQTGTTQAPRGNGSSWVPLLRPDAEDLEF